MILTSNTHFPKEKPFNSDIKYCLMVNSDNKVTMVWNYNAREYMDIIDKEGNNVYGLYGANKIKSMLKNGEVGFYFYEKE